MILAIGLALLGLILIYLEFFLPGGIVGAIGGLLIFGGILLYAGETQVVYHFIFFLVALILLFGLTLRLALSRTRKTINLMTDQEGFLASSFDHTLIGKRGTALSNLNPAGHISIDHKPHQALSETGYIPKDTPILVSGGRGAYLIVKKDTPQ